MRWSISLLFYPMMQQFFLDFGLILRVRHFPALHVITYVQKLLISVRLCQDGPYLAATSICSIPVPLPTAVTVNLVVTWPAWGPRPQVSVPSVKKASLAGTGLSAKF